ncbi:MAG: c-type cytochrome [Pirellulales bacterium]
MRRIVRRMVTCLAALATIVCNQSTDAQAQSFAAGKFKTLPGFEVETVYNVPFNDQGSWVCLCVDPKGRLIASDQYGKLYRVTLRSDGNAQPEKVERLQIDIGMAQGMYAFDNVLLININGEGPTGPGLYRLTDTNADDQYDKVEHLIPIKGTGEHGPHAIIPGPDGKIYFIGGNQSDVPAAVSSSVVPRHWSEDHILGRMPDGRGFMATRLAPGGWIARMDRDGKNVELVATGFRNEYDIAFNPQGDLFSYDADMEWDIGTPWYRPTRVNHVISGAEFGWRNGTGKWPEYYADSFGAVANIGPGSPTGITFGTGAKFPAKYQQALLISDWSYGIIYAVHMSPSGATYTGTPEAFVSAAPMAVTDLVVHPGDGSLYFAVGGRKTQSALYRLRYTGSESTAPAKLEEPKDVVDARALRRKLESFHGKQVDAAIAPAVAALGSSDRSVRTAARIALEHQPVEKWRSAALAVTEPQAVITAVVALARSGAVQDKSALVQKLSQIDFAKLNTAEQLELVRAAELIFLRLDKAADSAPDALVVKLNKTADADRLPLIAQLDKHFPTKNAIVNRELAALLVFLNAPNIGERCVEQQRLASAQEDQIHYAFVLREAVDRLSPAAQKAYFEWFFETAGQRGGASFGGFLANIRNVALSKLDDKSKAALGNLVGELPAPKDPLSDLAPRKLVKQWTVDELVKAVSEVKSKPNFAKGRELAAVAQCFKCHRFAGQGGIQGPDLTASSGRFGPKEMITAIVEPNKEVSDQYQATQFLTASGKVVVGRVANMNGNTIQVVTNMLAPGDFTNIERNDVEEQSPSKTSMMPAGLLDTLTADEVFQLLAYLKSGGNAQSPVYAEYSPWKHQQLS